MSDVEYEKWRVLMRRERDDLDRQNSQLEQDILQEDGKLKARQEDANYYKRQVAVLEQENRQLAISWNHAREDAKDTMESLQSNIQNHWFTFMDVALGEIPSQMQQQQTFARYTFIVNHASRIPEDCVVYSLEMYSSKPFTSSVGGVYAAIFMQRADGSYGVRSWSEKIQPAKVGLNVFTLNTTPLYARRGDLYGLIVCPGTTLDYNDFGFADYREVPQTSVPSSFRDVRFNLPQSKPMQVKATRDVVASPGREYAFMMRGITDSKHVFILDKTRPFGHKKTLGKVTITLVGPKRRVALKANLVIMRKTGYKNLTSIVHVSSPFTLPSSGTVPIDLASEKMNVESGDFCALVMSPGLSSEYIKPADTSHVLVEAPFSPRQSFLNSSLETNFIRIKSLKQNEYTKIAYRVE